MYKTTLLPLFLCLSACATVAPVSPLIRSTGQGGDCTSALQQAKLKAAEDYKGTFLTSQRSLVNDRKYSESVGEYSGGVVRTYEVLSRSGGSPCTVVIEAQMAPDSKSIVVNSESRIDLGTVERHLNKKSSTREILQNLVNRSELIQVESQTINPVVYNDGSVGMAIRFTKIVPSPKWMSDLESFLEVHGTKQTYRKKNQLKEFAKGVLAMVALPLIVPIAAVVLPFMDKTSNQAQQANPGDSFSLCFDGNNEVNCYQGWASEEIYKQINQAQIVAIMNKDGAPKAGFPVRGGAVSLNQRVDTRDPWVDEQNRPKSSFNLVSSKSVNVNGNLNFASEWVQENYDLRFRLKFN